MLNINKPFKFQVRVTRGVYYPEVYGGILLSSFEMAGKQNVFVYWSDNGSVAETTYPLDMACAYLKDGTWKLVD